ncbi:hypothetical protein B5X24_HaOG209967 [Helicoverpa armigera]|uniref:Peptidase S1 domain-containing protein n=1 Tax=Helicoverpa armigera TaxID=29058 RepID=A0A2W1BE54_HELAM|nr:hypothetical protein B5X24_HaOG209967 [Helicoverpa armigera]
MLLFKRHAFQLASLRYNDLSETFQDLYFDRMVALVLHVPYFNNETFNREFSAVVVVGGMITSDRILAPYNPFRSFIHNKTMLAKIKAHLVLGREMVDDDVYYYVGEHEIACGRQIIPDHETTMLHCHGKNGSNCPTHDLMVLRIVGTITFTTMPTLKYSQVVNKDTKPGAYRTEIAGPNDTLSDYFKFGSIGFLNITHIKMYALVASVEYQPEQYALVDCETWLPRDWGHFICVSNLGNYPALGSGAWLVSDEKVFGIGGFAFFRGKEGIFVFTDVRPYYNLIMNTCTYEDSRQEPPKEFLRNHEEYVQKARL